MKLKIKLLAFAYSLSLLVGCNVNKTSTPVVVLDSIEVSQNAKLSYKYNESFVVPEVFAKYSDNTTKEVSNKCVFDGFDSKVSGPQTIDVSYTEGDITKTTDYVVVISKNIVTVTQLEIGSSSKINFTYGEEFQKATVIAHYSDSSTENVTDKCNFSGYDAYQVGEQTINVSYTYLSTPYSTTYAVNVAQPTYSLTKIEVKNTSKTEYKYGESFVKPEVIATYSNSTTEDISKKATYSTFNPNQVGNQTIEVSYTFIDVTKTTSYVVNVKKAQTNLKFAIFADVQLCNEKAINGEAATNLGTTANSPIALRNHLQFCKNQGITTILMNGDITNQANEYYYKYFETILQDVYGSDESKYPEFVWNMGNHEWWWGTTEKETGDAVSMFKKYARISSNNLVKESNVPYYINNNVNVPSYYKVINGIPFIVISAESSAGNVGSQLENEIKSWLTEIKQLDSVKAGGPIFVEYHYPLSTTFTYGQGSVTNCSTVENIFKDTPNAVIFTGDTHYPGINERAINQVNFTTINLGSSSYSRMVNRSAVVCDQYYNVLGTGAKTADKLDGNVKFNEAYTPTIKVVEVSDSSSFTIDRYFTNDNGEGVVAGKRWSFGPIKSKADFTYTNNRFQNTASAQALYGKNGLNLGSEDKVIFGVQNGRITVRFPDVIDYHYCEHYKISVNNKDYDVVSSYYKNLPEGENNYYVLNDVPTSSTYNVVVTAYDFYDNPSTNTLTSSTNDLTKIVDDVDFQATKTYCDIQTRNRFDIVSSNSQSSTEYYYKGIQTYSAGAILNRIYYADGVGCNEFLSLSNNKDIHPTVKVDVKNLEDGDLTFGLSVVLKGETKDIWKDDFDLTRKAVQGKEWKTLYWDLSSYGVSSKADISFIALKARTSSAKNTGYVMNLLIDNIDIVDEVPEEALQTRGVEFKSGVDVTRDLKNNEIKNISTDSIVIDFKFTSSSSTKISIMLGHGWSNYFGYFVIYANGTLGSTYNGVTSQSRSDGYYRVTFNLSQLTLKTGSPGETINLIYCRGVNSTASGYIDIFPTVA